MKREMSIANHLPVINSSDQLSEVDPTIILTVNIVTSDLLLCLSFIFRIMYYLNCQVWSQEKMVCQVAVETMETMFYINLYCNMMLLLWTSVIRYTTVVRPHPAFLTPLNTTRGCWALCLGTWVTVVVCGIVLSANEGKDQIQDGSCFDMMENQNRGGFGQKHCLGVVVFFIALSLYLLSNGGLVLYLQKVRGARLNHNRERGVRLAITEGVKTVNRGVKEDVGVSTEKKNSGQKRLVNLGSKGGSLKVRRKILAKVAVFVACFLPYHVQHAVTLFTPQEGDCTKVRFQWEVTNTTKAIAALSCVLHPLLYLAQRHLSCCQGRQ
ncbi:hypothetical protein DPEC_G00138810 [Dallia pectoralis]|uniref:Uncharacterized protein n=1 Tax=Dallia pectoralis TaxID=75939 RepID=A0ACC2GLR0_DALPE|nr:hypothetical protein DPEC_G00138810 [Dallia pectoralis]